MPLLTCAKHQWFIEEQRTIISKLIRHFSLDREVFYTIFDNPKIVHDDSLENILGIQQVINEILYDQRGDTYVFYIRNLAKGDFTRLRGERDDIPAGLPQYDSDGNEILTDEESEESD